MRGLRAGKAMVLMSRQERTEAAGAQGGHCCSFPFHHPKHHRQDLLWDRRDQRDRQHLGLQTGPEEEAGVVTALRSALWARQSLGGHRDPKGATSYGGGGGSVLPKPTYGWSGQTLQTGEAAVALQPSLSSLSRLTFVTTRSLGTLKWGQGCVGLRVADPLLARRTPRSVRGMCRCTQHHSPAFLELQRDQRDPWALVHPAGRKKGHQKVPATRSTTSKP